MMYLANKYNSTLTSGYTVGQTVLNVSAVPENVPTLIMAAKGTDKETVFAVTGKTINTLTGVTRLRGANVNLDSSTPLTCINLVEFINQFSDAATGKASGETVNLGEADDEIVTPKAIADSYIPNIAPTGMVSPFAGSEAPTDWLMCDGADVSRTTYARLFEVIGTTYGEGDGSTTFVLPNLGGRVPVGKSAQPEFDTLGKTGGAKDHTLVVGQTPSHGHDVRISRDRATGGGAVFTMVASVQKGVTNDLGDQETYGQTNSVGGGGPHNNLQPYITLNYIIKT